MIDTSFIEERRWSSDPSNVHHARVAIRDFVSRHDEELADVVELAIGEACANAIEHGSPDGTENYFTVRCGIAPEHDQLVFEVEDEGMEFALTKVTTSAIPDLDSEGGRGLFLINQIMDEVALLSSTHGMIVRMTKRLTMPALC